MKNHILFAALALVVPALLSCEKENSLIVYGEIDGHEYVDLGLRNENGKVLFATMNVGASSPEEYGDYFAWGETSKRYTSIDGTTITGGTFEWSNCPYHVGDNEFSGWLKYIPADSQQYSAEGVLADDLLTLESSDDAAVVLWGGGWKIPDRTTLEWLMSDAVSRLWVENYNSTGVAGFIIRGRDEYAAASMFLPAGGKCTKDGYVTGYDHNGYYWSSDIAHDVAFLAASLIFNDAGKTILLADRYWGLTLRPVYEKN